MNGKIVITLAMKNVFSTVHAITYYGNACDKLNISPKFYRQDAR